MLVYRIEYDPATKLWEKRAYASIAFGRFETFADFLSSLDSHHLAKEHTRAQVCGASVFAWNTDSKGMTSKLPSDAFPKLPIAVHVRFIDDKADPLAQIDLDYAVE
jgi:hypothetical protein